MSAAQPCARSLESVKGQPTTRPIQKGGTGISPIAFENEQPGEMPMPLEQSPRRLSPTFPLFVWLTLQLIALGISAAHIPFYAPKSFPRPAEVLAGGVMLTMQITASAMLFPFLLRDIRAAGLVITASWPFTICSLLLTGYFEPRSSVYLIGYVTTWLLGLRVWSALLRTPRSQATGISLATLLTVGGAVIAYVQAEYSLANLKVATVLMGPLIGGWAVIGAKQFIWQSWVAVGGSLAIALIVTGICRIPRYRKVGRPLQTP
jgi:hypothetical protein